MKDYIVTVEETYFDATKFEIGGFYLVIYKGEKEEEFKCILTSVTKDKVTLRYYDKKGYNKDLIIMPFEIESGKYEIKEIKTKGIYKVLNTETDEVVSLSEGKYKPKYKDLYYNTCDIKTGRCYKIKIGELTFNGFCSYRNKGTINMVVHTNLCRLACITYNPTIEGEWIDDAKFVKFPDKPSIIHNTITNGTVMIINVIELKEDRVYFKELV